VSSFAVDYRKAYVCIHSVAANIQAWRDLEVSVKHRSVFLELTTTMTESVNESDLRRTIKQILSKVDCLTNDYMSVANISCNDSHATESNRLTETEDANLFIMQLTTKLTALKTHVASVLPANHTKRLATNNTADSYTLGQNDTLSKLQLSDLWRNITDALSCLENIVRVATRDKTVLASQIFGSNNNISIAPETAFSTSSMKTYDMVIWELENPSGCYNWSFNKVVSSLSSDDYEWIQIAEKLLTKLSDITQQNEVSRGMWQTVGARESMAAVSDFTTYAGIPIISSAASIQNDIKVDEAKNYTVSDHGLARNSASTLTSKGYSTTRRRLTTRNSHVTQIRPKSTQHPHLHLSQHPHATGSLYSTNVCQYFFVSDQQLSPQISAYKVRITYVRC
jgi:hypothetical protein